VDVASGGETAYPNWLRAVVRRFGRDRVADDDFELPRSWEFESWRSRRVLGDLEAESA